MESKCGGTSRQFFGQSGENMMRSANFATISLVMTHFRHFYGLQTQIDTLRISGRSLDACETRAVAPSPFRVLPGLRGTNRWLFDGPQKKSFATKGSERENIRR
jgi:hypothetical protein